MVRLHRVAGALRAAASRPRNLWLVFVLVSLANTWPFVVYRYVPFQDHPSHLLRENILRHFRDPELRYFDHFGISLPPPPYVLSDYLAAGAALFMPVDQAGKLVLGLWVFLLPLSVWFWVSRASPGNEPWSVLAWVLVWSQFLYAGNEHFCMAACLLFWFWGLLATWDGRVRWGHIAGCAALATAICLTHFLVFLLAGLGALVHVFASGDRTGRRWLTHGAIVAPGVLLAGIWLLSGGFATSGSTAWDFDYSLSAKLQALAAGILPAPWGYDTTPQGWWTALAVSAACFVGVRAVVAWRAGRRFPAMLCAACFAPALILSRCVVIYIPDQRIWWVAALASAAVLPRPEKRSACWIWAVGLALAVGTNMDAVKPFQRAAQRLTAAEAAFARFPKRLRLAYLADPRLPWEMHRCFEYYHLRYGGVGPHHFIGRHISVRYKSGRPPHRDIFDFGVGALGPWLDAYDAVLIVGAPALPAVRQMIEQLRWSGYRLHAKPPFALLLHPEYVRRNSQSQKR